MKVGWNNGVKCDPDSRDAVPPASQQLAVKLAQDVVRHHLPGVDSTAPSILETCMYTVGLLPRDAAYSAVFAVARCPSVCQSVTFVFCTQKAKDIVKLLSRPGSPIILVTRGQPVLPNSNENPLSGGVEYTGVGKICDFRLKSPFISETVRDRPMVAMER